MFSVDAVFGNQRVYYLVLYSGESQKVKRDGNKPVDYQPKPIYHQSLVQMHSSLQVLSYFTTPFDPPLQPLEHTTVFYSSMLVGTKNPQLH